LLQARIGDRLMSLDEVEALTFDVFGTVVDWRTGIAREARAILREGGPERDWQTFADRWRARYQPAMEAVRSGRRPWTRLDDLHRENLRALLDELGLVVPSEAEIEQLNRAWHRLDPWPDVVAGLTRLKRRFILATLSNGNVALMVNMARRAGLPWDAILGAEVARAYKPMPECYLCTADYLGLAPARCLMVAAHNGDLLAARACGFRTAFVARPSEHGPGQTHDLRAEHAFDVIATDFLDLADQLAC
jgi:2-haloacid dehalogenase